MDCEDYYKTVLRVIAECEKHRKIPALDRISRQGTAL